MDVFLECGFKDEAAMTFKEEPLFECRRCYYFIFYRFPTYRRLKMFLFRFSDRIADRAARSSEPDPLPGRVGARQ